MFGRRWRSPVVWLLLGDWLALALFVFLGLVDHALLSMYGWSRLLVRAWLHGQATIVVIFFVVMLGLGGLFLLGWRVAFTLWLSRRATPA